MRGLDREQFAHPLPIYRPAPLWVWNDDMTKGIIQRQLKELKEHGFGGAFVHPRPGLVTEYLSDDWFILWKDALDEAIKLNLKLYIYDENSYPSGFAGGHVSSQLPDCLANAVIARKLDNHSLAVLVSEGSPMLNRPGHPIRAYSYKEIAKEGRKIMLTHDLADLPLSEWKEYGNQFLIFELGIPETNSWLGGFAYSDLLRPEVTEVFLETTYEAYHKRFGDHFGGLIPAIFTDEPEISPGNLFQAGSDFLPFSYWFAAQFEQRNGYDLKEYLPCLFMDVEGDMLDVDPLKVCYDYYSTIHDLWVKNSVQRISEWCRQHNIAYTGHYLEHNWPYPWGRTSPSVMSLYEYMDWPAIDMLMTNLLKKDGTESHLMVTVREAHSAANQFNRQRVLCESYGAGGWDSTFEDYKRIGDWLFVHGINFLNQHLTYSTIVGARKRDHPQSFDWRQPWWEEYTELNHYFARLSYVLSEGETHNRILLLNPTTSFYLRTPDLAEPGLFPVHVENLKEDLDVFQWLCNHQWDYDFGDEYIIERNAKVVDGKFVVGSRSYDVVIIPSSMTLMKGSTYEMLGKYLTVGGRVIALGESSSRIDGQLDDRIKRLSKSSGWFRVTGIPELEQRLLESFSPRITLEINDSFPKGITHLRRVQQDGSIVYFIVNSGADEIHASILIEGSHIEIWNAWTGKPEGIPYEKVGRHLRVLVQLPASGSTILYTSDKSAIISTTANVEHKQDSVSHTFNKTGCNSGPLQITADQENMFIIDYCDVRVGSKTYRNINTLYAGRKVFEHHGFDANPWDNGIQFKRRLLERDRFFDEKSGFEVSYHFHVRQGEVPPCLTLLVERAEYYKISVNGHPIAASLRVSSLDHHIGEVDILPNIQEGKNTITLKANPFDVLLEVEAIYLKGDFGVGKFEDTWIVGKKPSLSLGSWVTQGYPFYGGAVVYKRIVEVSDFFDFERFFIQLPQWEGTIASVVVNGEEVGLIGAGTGNSLEITSKLGSGENEVAIRICGSFKNLLGPHHDIEKPRGVAWPGAWKKAPMYGSPSADQYDLIHYGLIEDFVITIQ